MCWSLSRWESMMVFAQLLSHWLSTVIQTRGLHSPRAHHWQQRKKAAAPVICFLSFFHRNNTYNMVFLLCLIWNVSWQDKLMKASVQSADYRKQDYWCEHCGTSEKNRAKGLHKAYNMQHKPRDKKGEVGRNLRETQGEWLERKICC